MSPSPNATQLSDLLTLEDLGQRLKLSARTLRRLRAEEGLPAFRLADRGQIYVLWPEVHAWILRRRKAAHTAAHR